MKRHEWWRANYRSVRDLDCLSPVQLSERLFDCMNNLRARTERGQLGLLPPDKGGEPWMVWFTEVLEECALRGYEYPGPINVSQFRSALEHAFDPIPDMEAALRNLELTSKTPYLLKFGERKWLQLALRNGSFRVSPASFYDSEALNHARRDRELSRELLPHARNPKVATFLAQRGIETPAGKVPSTLTITSPTDYYLFSLSAAYSSRLFGDFSSSACLIIYKPAEFISRLGAAVCRELQNDRFEMGFIQYFDPVRVDPKEVDLRLPFSKSFKHAYQSEMRLAWTPITPAEALPHVYVEIGSLENCAVLVDAETHPPIELPPDPDDAPIVRYGRTEDTDMVNKLPDCARMQGILLNREGNDHRDWFFNIQYTDRGETWHEVRVPMLDGLYLLNLLKEAEKHQHLGLWNRE